jgi:hypothetical protein
MPATRPWQQGMPRLRILKHATLASFVQDRHNELLDLVSHPFCTKVHFTFGRLIAAEANQQEQSIHIRADQALDHSISLLLATHKPGIVVGHDENAMYGEYGVKIEEGDIENDEDQLQAELE